MFDFGFAELAVIIAVAVFVIGPKDIPALLHNLGRGVRRLQYMKFALSQQFDDFMAENDLNEIRKMSVDPMAQKGKAESNDEMMPLKVDQNGEPIELSKNASDFKSPSSVSNKNT